MMELFVEIIRSSRPKVFCKKGVLSNFAKFTGKHLCQSLFFNKLDFWQGKKRLWNTCRYIFEINITVV